MNSTDEKKKKRRGEDDYDYDEEKRRRKRKKKIKQTGKNISSTSPRRRDVPPSTSCGGHNTITDAALQLGWRALGEYASQFLYRGVASDGTTRRIHSGHCQRSLVRELTNKNGEID